MPIRKLGDPIKNQRSKDMANNNPSGKNQHTGSDHNQGMKNAGRNERSESSQRSAGSRSDDQQGGKGRSGGEMDNQKRGDR